MIRNTALDQDMQHEQQANFHYSIPSHMPSYSDAEVDSYQHAASAMATGNPTHNSDSAAHPYGADATANGVQAANSSQPLHTFHPLAASSLPREKLSALHRQAVQIVDEWSQWKTAHRDNANSGLSANASSARPTSASTRAYVNTNNQQYSWRPSSARTFSQTQPSSAAAPARSTLHIIGVEDETRQPSQSRSPQLQPHSQPQFDLHRIGEKHLYDATPSHTSSRSSFMRPQQSVEDDKRNKSQHQRDSKRQQQERRRSHSRSRSRSPSTTHSSRSHSHSPRDRKSRRSKERQYDDDEVDMKEEKSQRSSRSRSTSRSPRKHSAEEQEDNETNTEQSSKRKTKKSSKRSKGASKKHSARQEVSESNKDRRTSSSHDSHRSSSRRSRSRSQSRSPRRRSLEAPASHRDRSYSPRSRSRSQAAYDDDDSRSPSRSRRHSSSRSPDKARQNYLQPDAYSRSEQHGRMTSPGRYNIPVHADSAAALSVHIDDEYGNGIVNTFSPNRSGPLNTRAVAAAMQQHQQQQQHHRHQPHHVAAHHQPFQQYADALEQMKLGGGRQMVSVPYHQPKRIHLVEENYPPIVNDLDDNSYSAAASSQLDLEDPLASHDLSSPTHHHHLSVHQSSVPSALSPEVSRYLITSPNGVTSTLPPSSLTLDARRIAHDDSISLTLRKRAAALAAASERLQVEEYNAQHLNLGAYDVDYPEPKYEQQQLSGEELKQLQQEEERQIRDASRKEHEALLFSQLHGLQLMQRAESGESYNGEELMSSPHDMHYRRSPAPMRTPYREQEQYHHADNNISHDTRTPPRSRPRSHSPSSNRRRSLSPRAGDVPRSVSRSPARDLNQAYEEERTRQQHHHHDSAEFPEHRHHHHHHQHSSSDPRPYSSPEQAFQGGRSNNDSNRPYDTSRSYEHAHDHHDAEVKYRINVSSADANSPSNRLSPRVSPRASTSRPSTADSTAKSHAAESSPSQGNENRSLSPQNAGGSNHLRPSRTQTVKELRTSIIVQQMQLQALMRQQQREQRKAIVEEEKGEFSPIVTNSAAASKEATASATAATTKASVKVEEEPYSSLNDPLSLDYDFDLPDVPDSWPTSPIHTGHTPPVLPNSGKSGSRRVSRRASLVSTVGLGQLSLEQQVEQYLEKQKQPKAAEPAPASAATSTAAATAAPARAAAAPVSSAATGVDPVVPAPLNTLSAADLDRLDAEARAARRARRAERERRQAIKHIEEQQKAENTGDSAKATSTPAAAAPSLPVPPPASSPDSAAYASAYYAQWAQSIWQQMQQQAQASHGANANVMQRPEYQQAYAAYINAYLSQLQRAGYPIQSSAFINHAATAPGAKPVAPVPIATAPLNMTAPIAATSLPPPSMLPQLIQQERAEAALRREVRDKRRAANFIKQYGMAAAQAVGLNVGDVVSPTAAYPPPPTAPFPVAPLAATAPAAHHRPQPAAFVPPHPAVHTYPSHPHPLASQQHHAAFHPQAPVRVHKVSQTPLFVIAPNAPANGATVSPSQPAMMPTPPRKSRSASANDSPQVSREVPRESRNSGSGSRAARIAARTAAVQQSRGESASAAAKQASFAGLPSKRQVPMYTAQERNEKERQQQKGKSHEHHAKSDAKTGRPTTSAGVNQSSSNSHASSKEASRRLYREHSFASRASLHTSEEEDWSSEGGEDEEDDYSSVTASNDDSRYRSRRRSDYDQGSAAASSEAYSDEPKPRSSNNNRASSSARSPARAQGRNASNAYAREPSRSRERQSRTTIPIEEPQA